MQVLNVRLLQNTQRSRHKARGIIKRHGLGRDDGELANLRLPGTYRGLIIVVESEFYFTTRANPEH